MPYLFFLPLLDVEINLKFQRKSRRKRVGLIMETRNYKELVKHGIQKLNVTYFVNFSIPLWFAVLRDQYLNGEGPGPILQRSNFTRHMHVN